MKIIPSPATEIHEDGLYSIVKRYRFFLDAVERAFPQKANLKVVELGCGTGEGLLLWLARALGPKAQVEGVEIDSESVRHGNQRAAELGLPQLRFHRSDLEKLPDSIPLGSCDVVIVSEILEHCENPLSPLRQANELLKPGGLLLSSIPNGYGPFEIETFFWKLFRLEPLVQKIKKGLKPRGLQPSSGAGHTLNDADAHVGFYTLAEVEQLIEAAGFSLLKKANRQFFCGPFSDRLDKAASLVGLGKVFPFISEKSASFLPSFLVADWLLIAQKNSEARQNGTALEIPHGALKNWWWKSKRRQNNCPLPVKVIK